MKQVLLISLCIWLAPITAQSDPMENCENTKDRNNCTPFYACIGDKGDWMKGHAIGWNTGVLAGVSKSGMTCKGDWTARNSFGSGQANLACDDGGHALIYFTTQDPETGTAIGQGLMTDGRKIKGWSGKHVEQFFKDYNGWPEGMLVCGPASVPLS